MPSRDPRHPRPQLRREPWALLDGPWDFALDPDAAIAHPRAVDFTQVIEVPFAPETEGSGIGFEGYLRRCWYRRRFDIDARWLERGHVLVHFGAVDRQARVWANGELVGRHVGGYTPFSVDVTEVARAAAGAPIELVVRADDQPRSLTIPRGKQDWWPAPHEIWYPRTTGIWQSVWLEPVPATSIAALRWTPDLPSLSVALEAEIVGDVNGDDTLRVVLHRGETLLVDDTITLVECIDGRSTVRRRFDLSDAANGDADELVWSPDRPQLLDATISYAGRQDRDEVASYTAIRSVGVEHGRFQLNGQPVPLRFALDQGFWPRTGQTAPNVDALRHDVEMVKQLGLNGVRKHQKVEDPRWLACCDELGVLVWEELPSAQRFSPDAVAALAAEWIEVVTRDLNHPCIVAWVPANESWGVPELSRDPQQRSLIDALASLTAALDPTRPISANDGWETSGGEIVGIHDYTHDAEVMAERYGSAVAVDALFAGVGPEGKPLTVDGRGRDGRAVVLSETGGTTFGELPAGAYVYGNHASAEDWLRGIRRVCRAILRSRTLSGYCWTQLTDTYQEANGLLRMDRSPKAPIEQLRAALLGFRLPVDHNADGPPAVAPPS
jgi:beta-galactosidase/beta-glucuronidase